MGTVARLSVSRSRGSARAGYRAGAVALAFPERVADRSRRIGCAPDPVLEQLVAGVTGLEAGRDAAALFRLVLLSQLASSLPAFRASLSRYDAFLDLGAAAAAEGKELGRHDFRRLFPAGTEDLQLVFLTGDAALLARRLSQRGGSHFFPASLLETQLATLEIPAPEERAWTFDVTDTPEAIVGRIIERVKAARTATG